MPTVDIFAWIHVETRDRLLWYDLQVEVKLCALTWLLVLRVLGDYIPIVIALPLLRDSSPTLRKLQRGALLPKTRASAAIVCVAN